VCALSVSGFSAAPLFSRDEDTVAVSSRSPAVSLRVQGIPPRSSRTSTTSLPRSGRAGGAKERSCKSSLKKGRSEMYSGVIDIGEMYCGIYERKEKGVG